MPRFEFEKSNVSKSKPFALTHIIKIQIDRHICFFQLANGGGAGGTPAMPCEYDQECTENLNYGYGWRCEETLKVCVGKNDDYLKQETIILSNSTQKRFIFLHD